MKFQVVNTGLIISLLINFVISFFFVSIFVNDDALGLGITLLIFICSIGILYTSVGDWWYRKIVLNQYIVIYKITSNQISFLKIFPQKTNYIKVIEKL